MTIFFKFCCSTPQYSVIHKTYLTFVKINDSMHNDVHCLICIAECCIYVRQILWKIWLYKNTNNTIKSKLLSSYFQTEEYSFHQVLIICTLLNINWSWRYISSKFLRQPLDSDPIFVSKISMLVFGNILCVQEAHMLGFWIVVLIVLILL